MTFAAVNEWPVVSQGSLGIDPVKVANSQGNALVAFVLAGSSYQQMPVFSIADDAHNFWTCDSHHLFGDRELEIWVAPNAAPASFVSVGSSWPSQSVTGIVVEFSGLPDFANIQTAPINSTGSGTTLSVSGTPAVATYAVSLFGVSDYSAVPTIGGPGGTWAGTATTRSGVATGDPAAQSVAVAWGTFAAGTVTAAWTSTVAAELAGIMVCWTQTPASPSQPNPDWPSFKVEAAFGFDPGNPGQVPTWTDITTYCIEESGQTTLSTSRGREYELATAEAGEMTLWVNNLTGAFNPDNASSPFFPNVTLETPVRVSAVWNNVTYGVAYGYISSLPQEFPDPQWGMVEIKANDGVSILSNIQLPSALGGEYLTDFPYAFLELGEFFNQAAGEPLDNSSRTNLKPAFGYNGVGSSVLETGLTLNAAGDPATGIGGSDLQAVDITRIGGARYLDYDLPQPGTTGCTLECVLVLTAAPNETVVEANWQPVIALEGPFNVYAPARDPQTGVFAQGNWRLGLVLSNQGTGGGSPLGPGSYEIFIQDFAGHVFSYTPFTPATVDYQDGNAHHHALTLTWASSEWQFSYYIDGVLQHSGTTTVPAHFEDVNAIAMGTCQSPCGWQPMGVWNYAIGLVNYTGAVLSPSRIQAHATAALTACAGDLVQDRFARLLTWAGCGLPRAGDFGSVSPLIGNADQIQAQAVTDAANALTVDDGGMFFSDAQGNNWMRSRMSFYNKTAKFTFGDGTGETHYSADAEFGFDNSFLYNQVTSARTINTGSEYLISSGGGADQVTVNNLGATAQEADTASEQQYFPRGPLEQDIETTSDQDAYDRASWSLAKYKQPHLRASEIELNPAADTSIWPVALGVEQGDIVQVNRRPIGAAAYGVLCQVQKVSHDIGPGRWITTLDLSPYYPDGTVIQLGTAGFDTISGGVLGW